MIDFTVTFYYDGQIRSVAAQAVKAPSDKYDAEAIAWGTIRSWFQNSKIAMPEFVRNITYRGTLECSWELLPMHDSTPLK
ncbi:MAG: hypothetical protein HDS64_05470 [Bacteroidales bacterium]|nr:hypothetical protein [Bacteroidales bacterium]MBD5363198.1 hypothetical protein [Bacteroides sp.]MBD5364507.1 hypothetical protein [Bacteroides sp.]